MTTPLHLAPAATTLNRRDYISYSALATYMRCPLKYYFKYVAGLPEETVASGLAFGGAIHAALEAWFTTRMRRQRELSQEALLAAFWSSWRERTELATVDFAHGESIGSMGRLANRVLTAFCESELARPQGTIVAVEEELRGELVAGVPDLLARIDLLVETEEALTVADFKTSRARWSPMQAEEQSSQLLLYGELARRLAPRKSVHLEFAVLTKTKSPAVECHPVRLDREQLERTKRVVERVWRAIESEHFYPAPSPLACPTCPYRHPCRAWPG